MSQSRFFWTEPVLCHYGHDISKSWFVYFDYTDQLTVKTIRRQFRGNMNRIHEKEERIKYANTVKAYWKKELENGWNPFVDDDVKKLPIHYSITEGLDHILRIRNASLKKKSQETYTYVVKIFKEWLTKKKLEDIQLPRFEKMDAVAYLDSLITDKGFAGRTHNDHLVILATLFNAMVDREWIVKNPFKKIQRKETSIGRNIAYSDQEKENLKKLLKKEDEWMYYFTQIMYFTFIRRSELAGLRVGDFDLVNNTIIVPSHVSKNGVQESVVIPVGLEPVLKEMKLHHYPDHFFVFGRHLFPSDTPYKNINHISTRHNKFLDRLKIDRSKGLYSHKHTGVCAAYYATGKDIYALMRQLRHRDLNTTQIYLKSLGLVQNEIFRNAMTA